MGFSFYLTHLKKDIIKMNTSETATFFRKQHAFIKLQKRAFISKNHFFFP